MSYQGDGLDLLPPNATAQERAMSLTISRISDIPESAANMPVLAQSTAADAIRDLWDIEKCPSSLLPWMAWALSVSQWNSSWTDTQKRAVLTAAVNVHMTKGTVGAVNAIANAFGIGASIQEWQHMTPPGSPYTFNLVIASNSFAQGVLNTLLALINDAKPARALMSVSYVAGYTAGINFFPVGRVWEYQRFNANLN